MKTQLGGGYRVHLPGTTRGPELPFPTEYRQAETVYVLPGSAQAAEIIAQLESTGKTKVFLNGPTIEDVFLKVAKDAEIPHHSFNKELVTDLNDVPHGSDGLADMKMSSGQDLTFSQQSRVLFHKRFTILLRSWFPHAFAMLIPIAATPAVKTFLASYKPSTCSSLNYSNFNVPLPLHISSVAQQVGNLQMLFGPSTIRQSLLEVILGFPIGQGLSISNFTNQFIFEDTLASFENHIVTSFTNVTPGAIFIGSNTTSPTYAFVGDFGIMPAMIMQNLWTQLRSGVMVAAYYTPFDSLLAVRGYTFPRTLCHAD